MRTHVLLTILTTLLISTALWALSDRSATQNPQTSSPRFRLADLPPLGHTMDAADAPATATPAPAGSVDPQAAFLAATLSPTTPTGCDMVDDADDLADPMFAEAAVDSSAIVLPPRAIAAAGTADGARFAGGATGVTFAGFEGAGASTARRSDPRSASATSSAAGAHPTLASYTTAADPASGDTGGSGGPSPAAPPAAHHHPAALPPLPALLRAIPPTPTPSDTAPLIATVPSAPPTLPATSDPIAITPPPSGITLVPPGDDAPTKLDDVMPIDSTPIASPAPADLAAPLPPPLYAAIPLLAAVAITEADRPRRAAAPHHPNRSSSHGSPCM